MTAAGSRSLFYALGVEATQLALLAAGFVIEEVTGDFVDFDDESGGQADRELAIPLLPGMDAVVVDSAQIVLRARVLEVDVTGYDSVATSDDDVGVVVRLHTPSRIRRIVLGHVSFPPEVAGEAVRYRHVSGLETRAAGEGVTTESMRVVVRPAEPSEGGFTFGPPIFADPPFPAPPSPFYGPSLAGLRVAMPSGGSLQVQLPETAGQAWLVQLAHGAEPTELRPLAFSAAATRVSVAAAPRNLSIVARGATPEEDVALWGNPNALLPESGSQVVSFTPVAQRMLSARLAEAGSAGAGVTLPVSLRFAAHSGGRIEVESRTLSAHYEVHPMEADPLLLRASGTWSQVRLSAPTTVRADAGGGQLEAALLGRELNPGSPVPPITSPPAGLRVTAERWAAASARWEPAAGGTGSALPLVSVQVLVQASEATEVVLEVRADSAAAPGPAVATPAVLQLEPGPAEWQEFVLKQPVPVVTGGAPLWVALRTNQGEVRWFAAGDGEARVSVDRGATWGAIDERLIEGGAPLALLFHASDVSLAPRLALYLGEIPVAELAVDRPVGEARFAAELALPGPILSALASAPPGLGPRADTTVHAFSRSVIDLTLSDFSLSYSPFQGG